jgi:hypothetical protein
VVIDLVERLTPGTEGLGFVVLLARPMSAITLDYGKPPRLTHLALEIDRSGASQIAFVVGLLHGRRRRLSQIHVGRIGAMCGSMPSGKAVGQWVWVVVRGRGWC